MVTDLITLAQSAGDGGSKQLKIKKQIPLTAAVKKTEDVAPATADGKPLDKTVILYTAGTTATGTTHSKKTGIPTADNTNSVGATEAGTSTQDQITPARPKGEDKPNPATGSKPSPHKEPVATTQPQDTQDQAPISSGSHAPNHQTDKRRRSPKLRSNRPREPKNIGLTAANSRTVSSNIELIAAKRISDPRNYHRGDQLEAIQLRTYRSPSVARDYSPASREASLSTSPHREHNPSRSRTPTSERHVRHTKGHRHRRRRPTPSPPRRSPPPPPSREARLTPARSPPTFADAHQGAEGLIVVATTFSTTFYTPEPAGGAGRRTTEPQSRPSGQEVRTKACAPVQLQYHVQAVTPHWSNAQEATPPSTSGQGNAPRNCSSTMQGGRAYRTLQVALTQPRQDGDPKHHRLLDDGKVELNRVGPNILRTLLTLTNIHSPSAQYKSNHSSGLRINQNNHTCTIKHTQNNTSWQYLHQQMPTIPQ